MILTRILPGMLKELLKHVPTVLFDLVNWTELSSEIPKITRRILQKEGFHDLLNQQKNFLAPLNVSLVEEEFTAPNKVDHWMAQKWLEIFFAQLFSPHGIFLDLRPINYQSDRPNFLWHPSGLWVKFEPTFHQGLLEIYDGFYLENEGLYQQGLKRIGLISDDWTSQEKERLCQLFKAQFGSSIDHEMFFDIEHFKSSIIKITDFLIHKKVTITKDFIYLGIYLVTLYSNLEESKQKLEVKKIYLNIKDKLSHST